MQLCIVIVISDFVIGELFHISRIKWLFIAKEAHFKQTALKV